MKNLLVLFVSVATVVNAVPPPLDDFMQADRLTSDGNVFTINQPDWKPSKFNLFGLELDDTHGFSSLDYLPLDNRGYQDVMEQCKEQLERDVMPMYMYSRDSTVNYFPDSESYAHYRGIDMIPQNKDNYVQGENLAKYLNFKDSKKIYDGDINIHSCRVPTKDGGAWHVQRIGPFNSTGGYDWWSISYPDVGMFSEIIDRYPQGK